MLGTSGNTKQVVSYGRRGQRIVPRQDRNPLRTQETLPTTPLSPAIDENIGPGIGLRLPFSQQYGAKAFTPPAAKPKRLRHIASKKSPVRSVLTPRRHPLATSDGNFTCSPAVVVKGDKLRVKGKATQLGGKKFTPFIDVEIIVLDDHGQRVSQERRRVSSATGGRVGMTNVRALGKIDQGVKDREVAGVLPVQQQPIEITDSEEEYLPKPPGRRRPQTIVTSSDDDDSDDESSSLQQQPQTNPGVQQPKAVRQEQPTTFSQVPTVLPKEQIIPSVSPPQSVALKKLHRPLPASKALNRSLSTQTTVLGLHGSVPCPPSFLRAPLPPTRARQLTPIRPGRRHARSRILSTPSDSDDADFDLSVELSNLTLTPAIAETTSTGSALSSATTPSYLASLLTECGQTTPHHFSSFIETFPFDPIVHFNHSSIPPTSGPSSACSSVTSSPHAPQRLRFRKIGEASYSEVFGIGNVVLKIIPLRGPCTVNIPSPTTDDSPAPSEGQDVLKEIIVTRAMGDVCTGFVRLLKTYIVRGRYPSLLLELWDEYKQRKGSESIKPDAFTASQAYAIIVLPNGGPDLEAFSFSKSPKTRWGQACSVFWQVVRSLAQAENIVQFEHRDLHWGQILVKKIPIIDGTRPSAPRRAGQKMDDPSHGVRVTIIDLGLSRMNASDGDGNTIYWTPFDEEIFEGEGDYQFDVYRMMREHHHGSWEDFRPLTNVMWLHYLATKLLHSKGIRQPAVPRRTGKVVATDAAPHFTEWQSYACIQEVETLLEQSVGPARSTGKSAKGRRKTPAQVAKSGVSERGFESARSLLRFAIQKGWVGSDENL